MHKTIKISNLVDRSIILPLKYGVLRSGETKIINKEDISHVEFVRLEGLDYIQIGNKKKSKKFVKKSDSVINAPKNNKTVKKIKRVGRDSDFENGIEPGLDEETGIQFVDLDDHGSRQNINVKRKQ